MAYFPPQVYDVDQYCTTPKHANRKPNYSSVDITLSPEKFAGWDTQRKAAYCAKETPDVILRLGLSKTHDFHASSRNLALTILLPPGF